MESNENEEWKDLYRKKNQKFEHDDFDQNDVEWDQNNLDNLAAKIKSVIEALRVSVTKGSMTTQINFK